MVSQRSLLSYFPRFDQQGFISNPEHWSETVAAEIARRDGLPELTRYHWLIIRALRDHFRKFGVAPPNFSHVCSAHHLDKHCIDRLFCSKREAWRIAGLPDPGEEARSYM
jgi:tRNA 2-thiouridine synthesizing protein E